MATETLHFENARVAQQLFNNEARNLAAIEEQLAGAELTGATRRLVQELELAVSVSISWGWRIDPGVFLAFAELAPGVKVEKAEAVLWGEIAKVADQGVTAAEVRRAKALLRGVKQARVERV